MDYSDTKRLKEIMRRAHRGSGITDDERNFIEKMLKLHPEDYSRLHTEVKNEAARSLNPYWEDRSA